MSAPEFGRLQVESCPIEAIPGCPVWVVLHLDERSVAVSPEHAYGIAIAMLAAARHAAEFNAERN